MATNNALLLGGVVVVGLWWWKKNNGAGFKPVQRSTAMTGSPTNFTVSNIQSDNWFSNLLTSTPAIWDAGPSVQQHTSTGLYQGVPQIGPGGRLSL